MFQEFVHGSLAFRDDARPMHYAAILLSDQHREALIELFRLDRLAHELVAAVP